MISNEQKNSILDTILTNGYRASAKIGIWRRMVSDAVSNFDEDFEEDIFTEEQWKILNKMSQIITSILKVKM